jgi:hypothetical protein
MTARTMNFEARETVVFDWQGVYRAGTAAAVLIVLAGLLDISLMFLPGTGANPGARTVVEWFDQLHNQGFMALRDLGLLNMVTLSCSVVVFYALLGVHRRANPLAADLAMVLVCIGAAIYVANNTALPMLTLSNQYFAATTEGQKALWSAAGQALLAQEDLTAGAFPGFFFAETAGMLMAVLALRGGAFRRWEAWIGIVGTGCLLIFNVCAAFLPALYASVMPIFGAGGGLLSLAWYAILARRLWRASDLQK